MIVDDGKSNTIQIIGDTEMAKHYWSIPVEVDGIMVSFMFDTGAGVSIISKSFAERHHMKSISDSVICTYMESTIYASVGVIDSLKIGNITFTHVPVYIKDEIFPNIVDFTTDAIFGMDLIEPLGVVKVRPFDMEMEIGGRKENQSVLNMSNFNGMQVVEAFVNNNRALLVCDTGAGGRNNDL